MPSMPFNVMLLAILAAAPATGPRVDALVAWLAAHEVPAEVWTQLTETIGPPAGFELSFVD